MGELGRKVVGKSLPKLTNPASAAQVLSGYQALSEEGKVINGTYVPVKIITTQVTVSQAGNSMTVTAAKGCSNIVAVSTIGDLVFSYMDGVGYRTGTISPYRISWDPTTGILSTPSSPADLVYPRTYNIKAW